MSRLTPERTDGWVGVDLDGTLALYDGWQGHQAIGEPVPLMLARVKGWLAAGREVRIVTARIADADGLIHPQTQEVIDAVEAWCEQHLGRRLPITCKKDFGMIELWDDRAIQVEPNTGEAIEEQLAAAQAGLLRALDYRAVTPEGIAIRVDVRAALYDSGWRGPLGEMA